MQLHQGRLDLNISDVTDRRPLFLLKELREMLLCYGSGRFDPTA